MVKCASCGREVPVNWMVCPACGAKTRSARHIPLKEDWEREVHAQAKAREGAGPLDELAREEGFEDFEAVVEAELPILWRENPWLESIARGIMVSETITVDQRKPVWMDIITQLYSNKLIGGRTYLMMSAASL